MALKCWYSKSCADEHRIRTWKLATEIGLISCRAVNFYSEACHVLIDSPFVVES